MISIFNDIFKIRKEERWMALIVQKAVDTMGCCIQSIRRARLWLTK